jgi:Cu/Ag efflux pump CusA
MLRSILRFSLQFRWLVLAAAAASIFIGVLRLRDAPVDVLPEFGAPIVEIQTEALGLAATEVEELVTLNIEELVSGVPWLRSIRSKSLQGLSSVLLVFEPGTDIMRARQMVHERLIMAHALPNVSKAPNMLQPLSMTGRAMVLGVTSKDTSLIDTSVLARWTIMPKLLAVPGVANVAIWGQRERQLHVQVDPKRLQDLGVGLDRIIETTGDALWVSPLSFLEASTPGAGGWIDGPNQRLGIQHVQPISTPDALAKVVIDGASLQLGEVAKVVEEHPPLIGDALVNNGPGLLIVVEKFPNADALEVARGVDAALAELRQGLPGIDIDSSIFRSTSFLEIAASNLRTVLLISAMLLILALFVSCRDWRVVLVSITAIALSLVVAGLVLSLRAAPFDMMVLAGLALAVAAIIHDAVTDTTAIMQRLRESQGSGKTTATIILEACLEGRSRIMYATLIALLATIPVFLVGGAFGTFLNPLAVSYVLALLVSVVVAMTVTPALALVLLSNVPPEAREPLLTVWLRQRYEAAYVRWAGAPRRVLAVAGLGVLAGLAVTPFLTWSLIPSFKERDVRVTWEAPPATSQPEMRRILMRAGQELQQIPGVRHVASHIGRAVTGDQVVGIESGQTWIGIDPNATYDATLDAIREAVQGYPGIKAEVQTYLSGKVQDELTDTEASIMVRVEGPQREGMRREAEKVKQALSGVAGIANPRIEERREAPHVQVEVDLAAAGRVGLKPGDVRRAMATVFAGLEVGSLFEQQKVFAVVVWGAPEARRSITDVQELLIPTASDDYVRLADVADVRVVSTPALIEREGITRRINIRADVAGREIGSVAADVKERLQNLQFPLEYHAVLLSDYANRQSTRSRALTAALLAVAGIYLLMQACFQSWRLPALPCLTMLVALAGGVLAMVVAGATVHLGSLVGFLAVLGIAARNDILLINHLRNLELRESAPLDQEFVMRGVREPFGPVVISTIAIVAALVPIVIFGNSPGLEIIHPMAVVILGGLIASALMNLFVLPTLYRLASSSQPETMAYGSEQHA